MLTTPECRLRSATRAIGIRLVRDFFFPSQVVPDLPECSSSAEQSPAELSTASLWLLWLVRVSDHFYLMVQLEHSLVSRAPQHGCWIRSRHLGRRLFRSRSRSESVSSTTLMNEQPADDAGSLPSLCCSLCDRSAGLSRRHRLPHWLLQTNQAGARNSLRHCKSLKGKADWDMLLQMFNPVRAVAAVLLLGCIGQSCCIHLCTIVC